MITPWSALGTKNFVAIGTGVSVPQIRYFAVLLGLLVCSFFGFFKKATAYILNVFLRKIREKTSFRVRKCLLGVPISEIIEDSGTRFPSGDVGRNCANFTEEVASS